MPRTRKQPLKIAFVAARTAAGRPALIHRALADGEKTKCGRDLSHWSRVFFNELPDALSLLRCQSRACNSEAVRTPANRAVEPGAFVLVLDNERRKRRAS